MRDEEDRSVQLAQVRAAAEKEAPKHRRLIKSARGGARLSAAAGQPLGLQSDS